MNDDFRSWLLDGPGWMEYLVRKEMLRQEDSNPDLQAARQRLNADPAVDQLKANLLTWQETPLLRHNDAKHPTHKLAFLVDLGLTADDPGMAEIAVIVKENISPEGIPQVLGNIPVHFGGTGKDAFNWMLCNAPLVLYCLLKLEGSAAARQFSPGINYLTELVRKNGFPCAAAPELGKFKGPGSRKAPCPYANLLMLKLLAELPELYNSEAADLAVESLLSLWRDRKERRPFLFAVGTHFNRLKAPLIWFDLLHVLDVLSRFPQALKDSRYKEMLSLLQERLDDGNHLKPESVWMAWKGWTFAQKKAPDPWISYLAHRIVERSQQGEK